MPNPAEVATVVANGLQYEGWEQIEIERKFHQTVSYMRLQVAEQSSGKAAGGETQELMPWDSAIGYLGGSPVITGQVCIRRAQYDKSSHLVLIVIASKTMNLTTSTVDGNPGFYEGYNYQQIAEAITFAVGVGFQLIGAPAGADKIFPRVSEHIGETRFQFVSRLASARNLYLRDDGHGTLLASRGTGDVCATLIEGINIEAAELTLRINELSGPIRTRGGNIAGSLTTISDIVARASGAAIVAAGVPGYVPETVQLPQPDDSMGAAMLAARVAAWNLAQWIQGVITVPGWFLDDGTLWIDHVGDLIVIQSPMLIRGGTITLAIEGVVHRQNNQDGTQTLINVCDPGSLGGPDQITTIPTPNYGQPVPDQ
jgi:prophage tail gpP-like protein